jgi:hypothetical protein
MSPPSTRRARRRLPRRSLTTLVAAALLALLALALTRGGEGHSARADDGDGEPVRAQVAGAQLALPVSVSIDAARHVAPVPPDFLGLSFEASSLGTLAEYGLRGNLVTLLRSLGSGMLRFGGVTADTQVGWADALSSRPPWANSAIVGGELERLRGLASASGWRVLLTLGLAHYEPSAAAREAAAAHAALGSALAAIEIGNEPDAYGHHGFRPLAWSYPQYDAQVDGYLREIARTTGKLPLAGPGVSGSRAYLSWGRAEATKLRPALLTGHHYPLGCRQLPPPSIERLLSVRTRSLETKSLGRYVATARRRGIGFRLDEAGSVSCGGRPGISNTFASALWAARYITMTMTAGVKGINLQSNVSNCLGYTPLCASSPEELAAGQLHAQPVWYALLLSRQLLGDAPLQAHVVAASHANVTVTALATPSGGLHLVAVDSEAPGSAPAQVRVRVGPGYASARVLDLRAPALDATQGVTLGGRTVGADGVWHEPRQLPAAPVSGGVVTFTLAPASAALVTVAR